MELKFIIKYINDNFPGCLEADYDSTHGDNPTCESIKSYFDRGCDVPLEIVCDKDWSIAGEYAHVVDLVDIQMDPNDSSKCNIIFANSWAPFTDELGAPDTDGLKGGMYQEAIYDDDTFSTENFSVQPRRWWGDHSCYIDVVDYICVDDMSKCSADED